MVILFAVGIGYFYYTRGNLIEAVWLTVTTISTLGVADTASFTQTDKIVSSILVLTAIIVFAFLIANVSEIIFSGQLKSYLGIRKMKEKIEKLKNHYILCGYGRIGKSIASSLVNDKLPFVVIESDRSLIDELSNQDEILFVDGDATQDDILREAGVERSAGLFSALGDDAGNILTVLNTRALNPKIKIVTRVSTQDLEIRFLRAGADYCISPQSWGSQSMVLTMLHPTISQLLKQFMDKTIEAGTFAEIVVSEKSHVVGKTLGESGIRKMSRVNVIGIRRSKDHGMFVNPQADFVVESGDTLICLGEQDDFEKLKSHLGNE